MIEGFDDPDTARILVEDANARLAATMQAYEVLREENIQIRFAAAPIRAWARAVLADTVADVDDDAMIVPGRAMVLGTVTVGELRAFVARFGWPR